MYSVIQPRFVIQLFRLRYAAVYLSLILLISSRPLNGQTGDTETLTNADVVKMVQAHVGSGIIVDQIRSNLGKYALTTTTITWLKAQGVSDEIIAAMQAKRAGAASATKPDANRPPKVSAPVSSHQAVPYTWQVSNVTDRMTGGTHTEAQLVQKFASGSSQELQVRATCSAVGMSFIVTLTSGSDAKAGFRQNLPSDPITTGGIIGVLVEAGRRKNPWVSMRLRIDQGEQIYASSESPYVNEASFSFARRSLRSAVTAIDNAQGTTDEKMGQNLEALASANGSATIYQIVNAKSVLVEFPLDNGPPAILDIHPQEPTFQQFAAACGGTKRPAAKPVKSEIADLRSYTIEELADALPGILQKAPVPEASRTYFESEKYDKEIELIVNTLRTCAQITPEMASQLQGRPYFLEPIGKQYEVCHKLRDVSEAANNRHPNPHPIPGRPRTDSLDLWMDIYQPTDQYWKAGNGVYSNKGFLISFQIAPATPDDNVFLAGTQIHARSSGEPRSSLWQDLTYNSEGVTSEMQMLPVLDNSIWIGDGGVRDKQIYVLAGPCCGYSQAFYKATRQFADRVQFRWIELAPTSEPKCINYLAEAALKDDPSLLARMYQQMAPPTSTSATIRDNAVRWNRAVEVAINGMRMKTDPQQHDAFLFPMLVWLSADGVKVATRPNDKEIQEIVNSVVARPETASITPAGRTFVDREYLVEPSIAVPYYAREDGVKLYALPDSQSQPLRAIALRRGGARPIGQVDRNGELWLEFPSSTVETWLPGFFIRASQMYAIH